MKSCKATARIGPAAMGLVLIFLLCAAAAGEETVQPAPERPLWSVTAFCGFHTERDLGQSLINRPPDPTDRTMFALAASRELYRWDQGWRRGLSLEAEALAACHRDDSEGVDETWQEYAALLVCRYDRFPWSRYVRTSLAVGDGYSFCSTKPPNADDDEPQGLNYLMFELALGAPQLPRLDLVYRIHHRSSVFNLLGEGTSNYYLMGLRVRF